MKFNWPKDYPKIFELYSVINGKNTDNFFLELADKIEKDPDFDEFRKIEDNLSTLDSKAWEAFKDKVVQYNMNMRKNDLCGYSQAIDCLNEVKGYIYLRECGYSNIEFIPESSSKTPDLRAMVKDQTVAILEVKTINVSDAENRYLKKNTENLKVKKCLKPRPVPSGISEGLKKKLLDTIDRACRQLRTYEPTTKARRIVYLVINLDIQLALNPSNYDELSFFLDKQNNGDIEIKYCYIGIGAHSAG